MKFTAAVANALWLVSNLPEAARFRRALHGPEESQLALLRQFLSVNADTAYGHACALHKIQTYQDFARQVPLITYDDLLPWIERIMQGEDRVLTVEPVTHLVPTGGSSGAYKLIPFTARLQREFNRAIAVWIADLYLNQPSLLLGPSYWSITPATRPTQSERSVVPIGFDQDTAYLGGARQRLVNRIMAVPFCLQGVTDMEAFRYLTLLCLLRQRDLRLISVWHPSFLGSLLDGLPSWWEFLLRNVRDGGCRYSGAAPPEVLGALNLAAMPRRAAELSKADPTRPQSIWPSLKVISAWRHGQAEVAAADFQKRFPSVMLQPKGLLATEAFVTVPFAGLHPIAIRSHFYEFIDDEGQAHLSHELQQGGTYEVAVTTGSGLWRYRLQDRVQVTAEAGKTPSLQFLGRIGSISDICGEKLSEAFVSGAIRQALEKVSSIPRFVLLAPDENEHGVGYILYIEGNTPPEVLDLVETKLRENPNYSWCRDLGQLKPLRLFRIKKRGYETFVAFEISRGRRLGEIKPCMLSSRSGWSQRFDAKD